MIEYYLKITFFKTLTYIYCDSYGRVRDKKYVVLNFNNMIS